MLLTDMEPATLQSGTYFYQAQGDTYRYRVLRYPCEAVPGGICFVLFLEEEDALRAMLRSRSIRNYVENCTGEIRQSVTGIAMASNMLHSILEKRGISDAETAWLNATLSNCYRLLKSVTAISDTVRYSDDPGTPELLNLGKMLQDFTSICSDLLCNVMQVSSEVDDNMVVYVPSNRLLNCLLSLLLLCRGANAAWNRFTVSAHRIGNKAVTELCVSSGVLQGFTHGEPYNACPLYGEDDAESDEYLVRRFCDTYDGVLEKFETPESRTYRLILPVQPEDSIDICNSPVKQYENDRFSRYHIELSALTQIKFFD